MKQTETQTIRERAEAMVVAGATGDDIAHSVRQSETDRNRAAIREVMGEFDRLRAEHGEAEAGRILRANLGIPEGDREDTD